MPIAIIHPFLHPPALVQVQATSPGVGDTGAAGKPVSPAQMMKVTPQAGGSDSRGQIAGSAVPGGVNHAPAKAPKAGSFSKPIDR